MAIGQRQNKRNKMDASTYDNDAVPVTRPQKTKVAKIVETGFLIATWLALGLYLEIFGPTQIDLILKLNTDYEHIAVAVAGRAVGLFPGCVLGGLLVDKFGKYCHLMMAVSLEIAAIVTVAVPYSGSVEVLWFLTFVGGTVESVINIAGQRCILRLWLEKATTPMILLHAGYGIGSFVIPLYTNPFLAVKRPDDPSNGTFVASTNLTSPSVPPMSLNRDGSNSSATTQPLSEYVEESRIEYSYMISAALVLLHSLSFYVFQIRENRFQPIDVKPSKTHDAEKKNNDVKDDANKSELLPKGLQKERSFVKMINPATCTGGHLGYGVVLFVFMFVYFGNSGGGERMIAGFIRSFSIDQLGFSKDAASYLNTSFWISFTVGRLGFAIAAKWISVRILIIIETGGATVIAILLAIFARHNQMACWVLVQPLGILIAPLWPTGVAWADFHLELTGLGMTMILLGGSVGGICHQRLIGYLYENIGPQMFLYQLVGYAALAFGLAVTLDLIGAIHGNRFQWKKDKGNTEENIVPMETLSGDK